VIKSRTGWVGHVARREKVSSAYKFSVTGEEITWER